MIRRDTQLRAMRARVALIPVIAAAATIAMVVAQPARAQAARPFEAPSLHLVHERLSDEVVAADQAAMDAVQQRLFAARARNKALPQYPFEKAQRWLSLAREAYEQNAKGTLANDALAEAQKLVQALESDQTPALEAGTNPPAYAPKVRPDLWKLAEFLRASSDLERVAGETAALEMSLIRAALESAGLLGCPTEKPQRVAEAMAMRAVGIINRPPPGVVAVSPARVDTLYIAKPVPMPTPTEPKATTPKVLTGVPPNVHFGLNLDTLSAASKRVLSLAADSLLRYAGVNITLSGNTDSRGNMAYNQALSKRRAETVKAFLVDKGIEAERIQLQALGKANLKTSEKDVVDLARNRRVDITYVAIDGRVIETKEGLDDLQVEGVRVTKTPVRAPRKKATR